MSRLPGGLELVEITSRRHLRARHPGVTTHESAILDDRDLIYIDNIPTTRTARTLCDAAALVVAGELQRGTLQLAILEAYRRNLATSAAIQTTWRRLGGDRRVGGAFIRALVSETP